MAGKVDYAIYELVQASELNPSNAAVWSDLAAAHLQRSTAASDPYELVLALAAANRAVRCDPSLQAGRFNRALALERLSLRSQAAAEWQLVSRRERDPLWAREAQTHIMTLARQVVPKDWNRELATAREAVEQGKPERVRAIVAGSPESFREYLEEKLLAAWAIAEKEHRQLDASKELAFARAIADALVAVGGDRMAADTIAQIERRRASDAGRFRRLVTGFLAYSEGLDLASNGLFSRALSRFQMAREVLAREGSPFAHWAAYQIALCQYQRAGAGYVSARARLLALTRDPASAPYKALQGHSLMLIALIDGITGKLTASVTSYKAAEAAFRTVKEASYVAKASSRVADSFDILGQRKEAWRWLYSAMIEPSTFDRPEIRFYVCANASWLARREGETEIALWFEEEVIKNAPAARRPDTVVGALLRHAYLLAALGRKAEAARDLAQARSFLQKISDPPLHRIVEGDLLLAESELAGLASPQQAIAWLDKALQIFRGTSYHYRLGHALHQRALAEKALGQNDAAERDLADAVAELEQQRETVTSAEDRISYFDRVKEILDTMITFQLEQRHRADEAFRFSEQAKARVLWDWMMARPTGKPDLLPLLSVAPKPVDLASLQRGLPERTAVIEYAVLPHKIVLWVLHRHEKLQFETVETDAGAVDDLVQRFRRAVLLDRWDDLELLSEEAYDLLIKPVARHLAPGERLVLVPDGSLHALPFSLLRNRRSRSYLIQERAFTVAPSTRVYVASRRHDRALAQFPGRVLVVAAPAFDPEIDPSLPTLSAGDTEASIAKIFPGSRVLREGGATRTAFLQAAGNFESLYFGGHSVVNVEFPLLSQMLFAKDPADPTRGVLYSEDVLRQRFPHTRLVVLASCSSAVGRISRTEGVENLARPFLATGVPMVIGSLWNVDDQATADFFVRFYRNLKQRFDVVEALRATQIDSIEHGPSPAGRPRVWSAFEVIGGGV